jgi:hypothetical protein
VSRGSARESRGSRNLPRGGSKTKKKKKKKRSETKRARSARVISQPVRRKGIFHENATRVRLCAVRANGAEREEPVFFLFGGSDCGRPGLRTFPTVAGGRLGKSRRWSSLTLSWPWPASRGRSGGDARVRGGAWVRKSTRRIPIPGSGLGPVTVERKVSERTRATEAERGAGSEQGKRAKGGWTSGRGPAEPLSRVARLVRRRNRRRGGRERTSSSSTSSSDSS